MSSTSNCLDVPARAKSSSLGCTLGSWSRPSESGKTLHHLFVFEQAGVVSQMLGKTVVEQAGIDCLSDVEEDCGGAGWGCISGAEEDSSWHLDRYLVMIAMDLE